MTGNMKYLLLNQKDIEMMCNSQRQVSAVLVMHNLKEARIGHAQLNLEQNFNRMSMH